jgi:AcrR family transcriptional regulator
VAALYQHGGAHETEANRQNDRSARADSCADGNYARDVRETQRSPLPADRLLDAAATLFDREGIRAVGVDRLIAEADVARASLYQNFGSKDALVVAWLSRQDEADRDRYSRAVRRDGADPLRRIRTMFELAVTSTGRRHYRGCLYVNALTEFPDQGHPIHEVITEHRRWQRTELADAARQAGAAEPDAVAERIQLLYDGGLVGAKTTHSTEPIRMAERMALDIVDSGRRPGARVAAAGG